MQLSIVIVNWNTGVLLQKCIQSIEENALGLNYEIIVVDNASHDGSADNLHTLARERLHLIHSEENLGFARGTNLGICHAKGDYVLLLNPDTLIYEGALHKSIDVLKENANIGALSCNMIESNNRLMPIGTLKYPSVRGLWDYLIWVERSATPASVNSSGLIEVEWAIGAYLMLPRRILDKVGLLDPDFIMFGDDMELCYRIKQAGYKIVVDQKIIIKHFGKASAGQIWGQHNDYNSDLYELYEYGARLFLKKHGNGLERLVLLSGRRIILILFILISGGLYFMTRRAYFSEMYWRARYLLRKASITEGEIAQLLLKANISLKLWISK